jgi:lipoprotein NlpD
MSASRSAILRLGLLCACTAWLAGCATPRTPAPVEERGAGARQVVPQPPAPVAVPADAPAVPPLPGAENAGKPGYYTVKQGDTLVRIGLESGQAWRDIAKWNNLENANLIETGQVLRVVPPGIDPTAAMTKPVASAKVEAKPLGAAASAASAASGASAASAPSVPASAPPVPAVSSTAPAPPAAPSTSDDDIVWSWPAAGSVTTNFDENRTKGMAISGKIGDPVYAAADGRVVYAGSGLRGYGNLVIVKHNNTYLTAYAHNSVLLVKEDQAVRRGQKIAEMGSSDSDRVQLHFEIRKLSKPIDPARLLPPR